MASEKEDLKIAILAILDEIEVTIPMRNNLAQAHHDRALEIRYSGRNEYRREVKAVLQGIRTRLEDELLTAGGLVMLPSMVECPRCGGDGQFKYRLGQNPGPLEPHGDTCTDCNGTGRVHRETQPQA